MKLYIETTVPNFLFADDAPEKQEVTRQFFQWLKISPDKLYVSELVLAELNRAEAGLRGKLLAAVAQLPVETLPISLEAEALAERYVSRGVIPPRYRDNAMHVAIDCAQSSGRCGNLEHETSGQCSHASAYVLQDKPVIQNPLTHRDAAQENDGHGRNSACWKRESAPRRVCPRSVKR